MPRQYTCKQCGKTFSGWPGANRQFCSNKCRGLASRGKTLKKNIPPLHERFHAKVNKADPSGCWSWTAYTDRRGRGSISVNGKQQKSHRVSYELFIGDVPDGFHVLHHCDNPSCVNPDHLFLGTHDDNMKDMKAKGRAPRGESSGVAKLTAEEVCEIRRSQETNVTLAARYDIAETTVSGIRHRKRWKHLKC